MSRCLAMLSSFFDRFLIDVYFQLRRPEPQKSLKLRWFYNIFKKIDLFKLTSFFHPILVPTCLHFPSQNRLKSFPRPTSRGIIFLIDFRIDFCTILGPSWKPSWRHVGHFSDQKWTTLIATIHFGCSSPLRAAPGGTPGPSKTAQDAPKRPPRRPKTPPRGPQDGPRRPPRRPQDGPKTHPKRTQDAQDAPGDGWAGGASRVAHRITIMIIL